MAKEYGMKPLFYAGLMMLFTMTSAFGQTQAFIPSNGDDLVVQVTASADPEAFDSVTLADGPYGAAVLPNGSYVLVTREEGDLVTAIPLDDFTDTSAQENIAVGSQPRGVAVESRGLYAYVANFGDDTVSRVNTLNWAVTATYDVGDGPWGVAAVYDEVDATVKVYVSNHEADSVSIISNGGVEEIENIGDGPLGVALTPDGRYLYVALYNADQVAIIDTDSLSVVKTLTVGNAPWGVAVGVEGAYVFVTNSGSNTVSLIDTGTQTVSATYSTGGQPFGVAAPSNGIYAYVVNHAGNSLTKITPASAAVQTIGAGEIDGAYGLGTFFGAVPPDAPSDLVAEAQSASKITLTWTDNSDDEVGYKIERRKDGEAAFTQVAKVNAGVTSYSSLGLERDTSYDFRVRAYAEAADSGYSNEATATTSDEKFSWCFIGSLIAPSSLRSPAAY
jgi:YVTN family beta-propeller protein